MVNRYLLMRHGHSRANQEGIILSDPRQGVPHWGLSHRGRKEVLTDLERYGGPLPRYIFSSPFKRAMETARIAADFFGITQIIEDPRLQERFFGELEGRNNSHYQQVWDQDIQDEGRTPWNCESPRAVQNRTAQLIQELEQKYHGETILLVAHGDSLQILMTWFQAIPPGQHRSLKHLETGEIRVFPEVG